MIWPKYWFFLEEHKQAGHQTSGKKPSCSIKSSLFPFYVCPIFYFLFTSAIQFTNEKKTFSNSLYTLSTVRIRDKSFWWFSIYSNIKKLTISFMFYVVTLLCHPQLFIQVHSIHLFKLLSKILLRPYHKVMKVIVWFTTHTQYKFAWNRFLRTIRWKNMNLYILFIHCTVGGDYTNRRKPEIEYPNRGLETDPTHVPVVPTDTTNYGPDGNGVLIMDAKNENRPTSFFAQPGILAGKF